MMTQAQLFYSEGRKIGEANALFLDLVKDGMTRRDLERNIQRRPELWKRWENWLETLPE